MLIGSQSEKISQLDSSYKNNFNNLKLLKNEEKIIKEENKLKSNLSELEQLHSEIERLLKRVIQLEREKAELIEFFKAENLRFVFEFFWRPDVSLPRFYFCFNMKSFFGTKIIYHLKSLISRLLFFKFN
jgi:hypothetical protein